MTLTEVLPKPIESGDEKLARKFADFLKHGKHFTVIEISERIAEAAGKLRGRYPVLKTVDAVQIAAALEVDLSSNIHLLIRIAGTQFNRNLIFMSSACNSFSLDYLYEFRYCRRDGCSLSVLQFRSYI